MAKTTTTKPQIPDWILESNIRNRAALLFAHMLQAAGESHKLEGVTIPTLCKWTGSTEATIHKDLVALHAIGAVTRYTGTNHEPNSYRLSITQPVHNENRGRI